MSAALYERATASKALAFTSIFCTALVTYFDVPGESLLVPRAASNGATLLLSSPTRLVFNLVSSQTAFRRVFPELVLGLGILYVFRHLERVLGSRKFVSFCLASSTLSVALQVCLLLLLQGSSGAGGEEPTTALLMPTTPGPFAPIFSLFVLYFWHVPALSFPLVQTYKYNSKLPVYVAGAFLATVDGKSSLLPAAVSLLAGVLVYSQLARVDMPDALARFGTRYLEPLLRRSEPRRPNQQGGAAAAAALGGRRRFPPQYGAFGQEEEDEDQVLLPNFFGAPANNAAANRGGVNQPPIAAAAQPEPREEDVLALVQMGFDIDAATDALRRNRNDVNRAADSLLFQTN